MSDPADGDDLRLNAFVDGALSSADRAALLQRAAADPALGETLCRLTAVKEHVRLAYEQPPQPHRATLRARCLSGLRAATIAALALMLGFTSGWMAHGTLGGSRLATAEPELRLLVHVARNDAHATEDMLDEIAALLESYRNDHRPLRVEVIANGDGLAMLRTGASAYEARIHALAERYPNLSFVACQNTIDRLRAAGTAEVRLVPDAELTPSGVSRVARRQREGWAYIQV